jgi:hypothetical protein
MIGICSTHLMERSAYKLLVGNTKRKRPLGGGWIILRWILER